MYIQIDKKVYLQHLITAKGMNCHEIDEIAIDS